MDFNYFYGRGADQFAFYQIPKILITDEKFAGITMESKILYSLMLDRASLSAKNGWLDEDGIIITSEEQGGCTEIKVSNKDIL